MLISWDVKGAFKKDLSNGGYFDLGIAFWLAGISDEERVAYGNDLDKLHQRAVALLRERKLEKVFYDIEMPLIKVLVGMENLGIGIDQAAIRQLQNSYTLATKQLQTEILADVGEKFNLNSPRQLSKILFEKLRLGKGAAGRRTKTGQISTNTLVLEKLRGAHPIVEKIIQYREQFKLLSTYIKPWSLLGDRVHPTFLQTGTATGRLSCHDPNLQNVPADLRLVFVPAPGYTLVSCDYSQVQLRILATVAGDEKMLEAFAQDVDIHTLTASQVFHVPIADVTKEMRRIGKTLNFGMVYGMGAVAFARTSGVSRKEAEKFIAEYFKNFAQVHVWQERVRKELLRHGYVENPLGRRRYLLDITSDNPRLINEAYRAAINMPIQSMEADIMKLAMIAIHRTTHQRIVLTVHDELLFELPDDGNLKEGVARITSLMEGVYKLAVPLRVEAKVGKSWAELGRFK